MEQYRPAGFQVLPTVVKNLLIINGIFFLAMIAMEKFGIDLQNILGLHYFPSKAFKPYQLITYMFMHHDFWHIFFNLFAVWMFGAAIENFWGPKRFLIYYLVTGIGAALLHYLILYFEIRPVLSLFNELAINPDSQLLQLFLSHNPDLAAGCDPVTVDCVKNNFLNAPVIVGASGALFGLLLAFGWMFPNSTIYIYFAIPVKAKYFVILYGVIEIVSGVTNFSGDKVAHFAHIGGMLFGLILLKIWKIRRLN
jgi:membrane associated rhomboid family serine protease